MTELAQHFTGNSSEQGSYLGLPLLAIVVLFLVRCRATPAGRFLVAVLVIGFVAALGAGVHVAGHRIGPGPWAIVGSLPLFNNLITARFALYLALATAAIVALWAAGREPRLWLRVALPILAVIAILPQPEVRPLEGDTGRPGVLHRRRVPRLPRAGGERADRAAAGGDRRPPPLAGAGRLPLHDGRRRGLARGPGVVQALCGRSRESLRRGSASRRRGRARARAREARRCDPDRRALRRSVQVAPAPPAPAARARRHARLPARRGSRDARRLPGPERRRGRGRAARRTGDEQHLRARAEPRAVRPAEAADG